MQSRLVLYLMSILFEVDVSIIQAGRILRACTNTREHGSVIE